MKKLLLFLFMIIFLCSSCSLQKQSTQLTSKSSVSIKASSKTLNTNKIRYVDAYTKFLLNSDNYKGDDDAFPVFGFYLIDMNFDKTPELAVLHDSGGSMGGYFQYFQFDGKQIVPILDVDGSKVYCSNYTHALIDNKNKKIYFLKEMYHLQGNENGSNGYVRKIITQNGIPVFQDILDLEVNQDIDIEKYDTTNDSSENDFLNNVKLKGCLITKYNSNGTWKKISTKEYLRLKQKYLGDMNNYADLYEVGVHYYFFDSESQFFDYYFSDDCSTVPIKQMTRVSIDFLFSKWLKSTNNKNVFVE